MVLSKAGKLLGRLGRVVDGFVVLALTVLLLTAFTQVFFRYLFRIPLVWATEFIQLNFVLVVYLGVVSVAFRGRLIAADVLGPALSEKSRKIHGIFVALISAIGAGVLAWLSVRVALARVDRHSLVLHYPISFLFVVLVIGMSGIAVVYLGSIVRDARRYSNDRQLDEPETRSSV